MTIWGTGPSGSSEFDTNLLKDIKVSRDFKHAHPELVKRIKESFDAYIRMFPTRQILVTCTYRSPEEQKRLFLQGRFGNPGQIVTNCDGYEKKSNHNKFPARAVDIAICDGGKLSWEEAPLYPLGNLARECGLSWGGFWTGGFRDYPHFELPKEIA